MTFLALLRKELRAYLTTPLVYVVGAVFYLLTGFFFYTQLIYFVQYGFGLNLLGNFWLAFLAGAPYSISMVLVLVVPLLTMRLVAEEWRLGTMEFLLTTPLRDGVIVGAKLSACVVVVALLLGGTLTFPLFLATMYPLPWLPVLGSYLGLLLLALSFTACGLFVSALTDSQVVAAVGALGLLLFFWALSWNEAAATPLPLRVGAGLAMFDHFEPFARGVIDGGDVAYFVAVTAFFTFLTLRVLEARRRRGRRS